MVRPHAKRREVGAPKEPMMASYKKTLPLHHLYVECSLQYHVDYDIVYRGDHYLYMHSHRSMDDVLYYRV